MAGDPCLQMVIGAAQATHDIEHQDPIGHRTPDVVKSISHALHPPAELNGEVPLLEDAEVGVKLESAELGVADELPLKRQPGLSRVAAVGSAPRLPNVLVAPQMVHNLLSIR